MGIVEGLPKEFPEHFAAWVRIEPRCRRDDFSRGLAARTADPLWMLTRQWQTGELSAEDAGSPIRVEVTYETQPLARVKVGENGDAKVGGLPAMPLETMVEEEHLELSWRDRVQIGQQFEQFIRAELADDPDRAENAIKAYRREFPLNLPEEKIWVTIDRATRRFLKLVAGRVVDGKTILDKIDDEIDLLPPLGGITTDQLQNVVSRLKDWRDALNIQPRSSRALAWRNQHLDYRFEVNPPEGNQPVRTHLVAPDYRNGALDWHTFNAASEVKGEWSSPGTITLTPKRVSVGGSSMRWWAFEDAATDFGSIEVAKPDIARLLLMEFVLIYGDDWFVIPLTVTMPNLVKIKQMSVSNVFGENIPVGPARIAHEDPLLRFDLFTLSSALNFEQPGIGDPSGPGKSDFLVVPPVAGYREESPALEEIRFLRDEGANKVWGVEHFVVNGLGRQVDGFDAQRERLDRQHDAKITQIESEIAEIKLKLSNDGTLTDDERKELNAQIQAKNEEIVVLREGSKPSSGGIPRYRLATTVPDNWIPFAPFNVEGAVDLNYRCIRLRRAKMLRNEEDEEATAIPAMSRLLDLEEDPLLWLEEATVARSGLRVQLTGQRVRWVDGKTYVWKGRKVLTGKGEGSSGLLFDHVSSTQDQR